MRRMLARLGILAALGGVALPVNSQTAATSSRAATLDADKTSSASASSRNVFAQNLKPKVKRPTNLQNQPYTPIKKNQDEQSQVPEIEMFVGESRVFPAPGVARIAVGNGQIMTAAALDNKEILIFANGIGTSSLFVWNDDGRYQSVKVNIVPGDTSRIAREVAAFLTTIPNAKASIVGDKVIIEGDNLTDVDLSKIDMLEKKYPQIVNFTNRVGWEQMVMMDVKVVEFPKTELRDIGLKWSTTGGAAVGGIWRPITRGHDGPYLANIPTAGGAAPISDASGGTTLTIPSALNIVGALNLGLNAQLNLLAQSGKASILAEPQLSARNGASASFLAGGEYPYSISTINGVTVLFKPYGIKLDVTPRVDQNGVIRATIKAEVSSIDPSVTTAGGPALLTRRTDTEFNVRNGETIVLAGLLQRDSSTNIEKIPLLGDIPILGALFRSKRFQDKETELVIFVTPTVIDSHSPGLVDRVERTTERLQQNLGKKPYLTDPLQPGRDPAKPNFQTVKLAVVQDSPPVVIMFGSATRWVPGMDKLADGTLRVVMDGLVLRAEPNVTSRSLLQLGVGSVVQVATHDVQAVGDGNWRNVVAGALKGWVVAEGVAPSQLPPTINAYGNSAVARSDQNGNVLSIGSNSAGKNVAPRNAKPMTPETIERNDAGELQPRKRYRVALSELALRVMPDVNAPLLLNLKEGQVVEALPQAPSSYWLAVDVEGKRGWVASQWLNPVATQP